MRFVVSSVQRVIVDQPAWIRREPVQHGLHSALAVQPTGGKRKVSKLRISLSQQYTVDAYPSLLNDNSSDCKGGGYGTSSMSPSSLPWLFLSLDSSAPFPGSRHVSDCKFGFDAPSGCLKLDIFLLLTYKRLLYTHNIVCYTVSKKRNFCEAHICLNEWKRLSVCSSP